MQANWDEKYVSLNMTQRTFYNKIEYKENYTKSFRLNIKEQNCSDSIFLQ